MLVSNPFTLGPKGAIQLVSKASLTYSSSAPPIWGEESQILFSIVGFNSIKVFVVELKISAKIFKKPAVQNDLSHDISIYPPLIPKSKLFANLNIKLLYKSKFMAFY